MDLLRLLRAVTAHWLLVLAILLVTAFTAAVVGALVKPQYQADTSMILLAPSTQVEPSGERVQVNPYSRSGLSGEGLMSTSVTSILNSDPMAKKLFAEGVTGEYTVALDPSGGGAIINLSVISATADDALRDSDTLRRTLEALLVDVQRKAGAPDSSLVRAEPLTELKDPKPLLMGRIKVVAVIILAGLVSAVGAASTAQWRQNSRTRVPWRAAAADEAAAKPMFYARTPTGPVDAGATVDGTDVPLPVSSPVIGETSPQSDFATLLSIRPSAARPADPTQATTK